MDTSLHCRLGLSQAFFYFILKDVIVVKTTPIKGACDYLPNEVAIRDYLQTVILRTYQSAGFERIITPILEDIENLDKSDGGENLSLIFRIQKRGEKFKKAIEENKFNDLCDMGLRYDLTLPLTRYYANNRSKLTNPFKVIQMDRSYRAEQPQKGRLREFTQCDIDILGSTSINCEVEIIDTATLTLLNMGLSNFKVKINDRRILKDILSTIGFNEEDMDSVSISIDKLDKIGFDGVKKELLQKEFSEDIVDKFVDVFKTVPFTLEYAKKYCEDTKYIEELENIINCVNKISENKYIIEYDITLVRGQGYYTGPIFEIESLDFKGSIAGGGRYDNLVGKFIGEEVPAVGISIGFERIFSIFKESNFSIPEAKKKLAIIHKDDEIVEAINYRKELINEYDVTLFTRPKKLGKLKERLYNQNYHAVYVLGESIEVLEKKI